MGPAHAVVGGAAPSGRPPPRRQPREHLRGPRGMRVLIDTNLLARIAEPAHPHHPIAARAVGALAGRGDTLHVVPQNFYELWVVATRPVANNGLGMSSQQAEAEIQRLRQVLDLLTDIPAIFDEWQRLVVQYDCKGKVAHDARLVAAMNVHGIRDIVTFNGSDFVRYPNIRVIDPATVAIPSPPL